jgi:hypothetical protein
MTTAREYDSVRTTTDIMSDDGRTIPAGMRGAVLHAKPGGTCLAEFAFTPQTADTDGDFVQGVLTEGQYEIVQIWSSSCRQLGGAAGEPGGDLSGS